MDCIVLDVDLISKVFHWALDTFSDTFNDQPIDVVYVRQPRLGFLVWLDVFLGNFQKSVNFFTMDFDIFKLWANQRLMVLFELIWWEWFHPSVEEGVSPFDHHLLHLANIVFHKSDELMDISYDFHCIFDEWVNAWWIPSQVWNTWFKSFVYSLNSVIQQRLFNWKESFEDLIVDVYNDIKISFLGSVGVHIFVKESSFFRNINVKKLEILNFSQKSDKNWIKVDSDKAFFDIRSCFFSDKKAFVEVIICLLQDTGFPLWNLEWIVFFDVLVKGNVKFLDIFVLFSVMNRLWKFIQLIHWFLNSFKKTFCPVQRTSNWR